VHESLNRLPPGRRSIDPAHIETGWQPVVRLAPALAFVLTLPRLPAPRLVSSQPPPDTAP
jgi:hypothetical protein